MKHRKNPGQAKGPRHKTRITGNAVRKQRQKLGLSQRAVAKLCRAHQTYISYLENKGNKTISLSAATRLIPLFGKAGKRAKKKLRRATAR